MDRQYIKFGVVAAVVLGFVGVMLYQFTGGLEYSADISGLKTQFNRDKGSVRLVVLLSPT